MMIIETQVTNKTSEQASMKAYGQRESSNKVKVVVQSKMKSVNNQVTIMTWMDPDKKLNR